MSPDELAFLAAVRAAPYAAIVRLVYADYLDDQSRPAEANFLRWQASLLAIAGPADLDPARDLFRQLDPVEAELWRVRLRALDPAWVARVHLDFAAPPGLSPEGLRAVEIIVELLAERGEWDTDGAAPAFRAPAEWLAGGGRWPEPVVTEWFDPEYAEAYGYDDDEPDWVSAVLLVQCGEYGASCLKELLAFNYERHGAIDDLFERHGLRYLKLGGGLYAFVPHRPPPASPQPPPQPQDRA